MATFHDLKFEDANQAPNLPSPKTLEHGLRPRGPWEHHGIIDTRK